MYSYDQYKRMAILSEMIGEADVTLIDIKNYLNQHFFPLMCFKSDKYTNSLLFGKSHESLVLEFSRNSQALEIRRNVMNFFLEKGWLDQEIFNFIANLWVDNCDLPIRFIGKNFNHNIITYTQQFTCVGTLK